MEKVSGIYCDMCITFWNNITEPGVHKSRFFSTEGKYFYFHVPGVSETEITSFQPQFYTLDLIFFIPDDLVPIARLVLRAVDANGQSENFESNSSSVKRTD